MSHFQFYTKWGHISKFDLQKYSLKDFKAFGAKTNFYNLTVLPKPTIPTFNRYYRFGLLKPYILVAQAQLIMLRDLLQVQAMQNGSRGALVQEGQSHVEEGARYRQVYQEFKTHQSVAEEG